MSIVSDKAAIGISDKTVGTNAARFNAKRIRELVNENKLLLREVQRAALESKKQRAEVSRYKMAISDFNAAFMEWMPRLRHTDNSIAQNVAQAMREFKGKIKEELDG